MTFFLLATLIEGNTFLGDGIPNCRGIAVAGRVVTDDAWFLLRVGVVAGRFRSLLAAARGVGVRAFLAFTVTWEKNMYLEDELIVKTVSVCNRIGK